MIVFIYFIFATVTKTSSESLYEVWAFDVGANSWILSWNSSTYFPIYPESAGKLLLLFYFSFLFLVFLIFFKIRFLPFLVGSQFGINGTAIQPEIYADAAIFSNSQSLSDELWIFGGRSTTACM